METGESTATHPGILLARMGAVGSLAAIRLMEGAARPEPVCRVPMMRVEPEDLARFEGEGGLEAPEPVMPSSGEEVSANKS